MHFKYLKRYSISLIRRGIQIKAKRYHSFIYEIVTYEKTFLLHGVGESLATQDILILTNGNGN